jgi:hypothetical protein
MRFAYADPPYIGQAKKHYDCEEIDHHALIEKLVSEFPDGWVLSCSSPTLRYLLPLCPEDVRVMAWVKPFCIFKPNVNPAYAWEPLIVRGGRKRTRKQETVRDWISQVVTLKKGLVGAKPPGVCHWILRVLNFQQGDEMVDLFPGTGSMGKAVEIENRWYEHLGEDLKKIALERV